MTKLLEDFANRKRLNDMIVSVFPMFWQVTV
jgi:hypothetical protein